MAVLMHIAILGCEELALSVIQKGAKSGGQQEQHPQNFVRRISGFGVYSAAPLGGTPPASNSGRRLIGELLQADHVCGAEPPDPPRVDSNVAPMSSLTVQTT